MGQRGGGYGVPQRQHQQLRQPPAFSTPIKIQRPKEEVVIRTTKYKKPVGSLEMLVREPQHSLRYEVGLFRRARSGIRVGPWVGDGGSGRVSRGDAGGAVDGVVGAGKVRGSSALYLQESQGRVVGGALI